jgi:flagellar assembly protein FliH
MTNSSPEPGVVLRGSAAATAVLVRLDQELRRTSGVPEEVLVAARAAAHAEGYATGWAQGRQEAAAAVQAEALHAEQDRRAAEGGRAEQVTQALTALDAAAAGLAGRCAPVLAEAGDTVARIAFAVTEALLARELAVATDPGLDAVRRALAATPTSQPVLIHLNPADHAVVAGGDLPTETSHGREVTLVADASVAPGDAVAVSGESTVDAGLLAALARVPRSRPPCPG